MPEKGPSPGSVKDPQSPSNTHLTVWGNIGSLVTLLILDQDISGEVDEHVVGLDGHGRGQGLGMERYG